MLRVRVLPADTVKVGVAVSSCVNVHIPAQIVKSGDYPDYAGPYDVTPMVTAQRMETKDTHMTDDVTIQEIPYYAVSNPQGGTTIVIGGDR
nr:MAG TPA: hypothetical protein [Caudoviricetes sp.]